MSNTPKNHGRDDFTAAMRDEQARGKDPYLDPKKDKTLGGESFASQEQRRLALQMVDDPEGLMTEAQRTGDTVPAVRWKYQRILSGVQQESEQSTANSSKESKHRHTKR
ncbi:hypothetical protein PG994_015239 [Apiospora phragmitis]|uniref:Uncharacterized protein n=1 Tax=Apiospora phragmitis TaxID=2905665 RepID=A0ABR1SRB9_9PEZI